MTITHKAWDMTLASFAVGIAVLVLGIPFALVLFSPLIMAL
jgi:hypothetical protein